MSDDRLEAELRAARGNNGQGAWRRVDETPQPPSPAPPPSGGLVMSIIDMHARTGPHSAAVSQIRQVEVEPMRSEFARGDVESADALRPPYMQQLKPQDRGALIEYENERIRRRALIFDNQVVLFATSVASKAGIALPREARDAESSQPGARPLSSLVPSALGVTATPAPVDSDTTRHVTTPFEMTMSSDPFVQKRGLDLMRQDQLRDATQYMFRSEVTGLLEINPIIDAEARSMQRELMSLYPRRLGSVTLEELIYSKDWWVIFADLVGTSIAMTNSGPSSKRDHLRADFDRAALKKSAILLKFKSARYDATLQVAARVYDPILRRFAPSARAGAPALSNFSSTAQANLVLWRADRQPPLKRPRG